MSDFCEEILFYSDEDLKRKALIRGPKGMIDWGVTGHTDVKGCAYFKVSHLSPILVGQVFSLYGGTCGTFVIQRDDKRDGWVMFCQQSQLWLDEQTKTDKILCEGFYRSQREENYVHGLYVGPKYFTHAMILAAVARESKRLWEARKAASSDRSILCPIDDPDFA